MHGNIITHMFSLRNQTVMPNISFNSLSLDIRNELWCPFTQLPYYISQALDTPGKVLWLYLSAEKCAQSLNKLIALYYTGKYVRVFNKYSKCFVHMFSSLYGSISYTRDQIQDTQNEKLTIEEIVI